MSGTPHFGETRGAMSVSAFVPLLAVGAGALALWVDVRFPSLASVDWRIVFGHLFAAMLMIHVVMPDLLVLVRDAHIPGAYSLAAVGVALPAIMYLFLASIWTLKLAQRLLGGLR